MIHRRSRMECWLAAALLAAGLVLSGFAQGTLQKSTPLQYSRPQSPNFTNSIGGKLSPAPKQELEQLGEALFRTEQPTAPKSSMDLVVPYMSRSALSKKALREMNERRREIMFGNTEALANSLSVEQDSKPSDDTGRKLTPVEEYYQRVVRQQKMDSPENVTSGSKTETKDDEERNLPPELKERTKKLQALLGIEPSQGAEKEAENPNGLEFFKGKNSLSFSSFEPPQTESREVIEERKTRMDQFRQMTGVPSTDLSPIEMFKQLGTSSDPLRRTMTSGASPATAQLPIPAQDASAAQFGSLPSLAALPEANRGLSLPSVAPSTLKSETPPPVRLPPPAPTFTAPKRPF